MFLSDRPWIAVLNRRRLEPLTHTHTHRSINMLVSVAVLGCGPGGMSFCHAVETLRRAGESGEVALSVTCFEKSSSPGGVWKAANPATSGQGETVNMYAALWTNGPAHGTEYFDYTYDEHFNRPVTVYMPRQQVLGYMFGRVTRHCPDFFQKYVQFDTEVVHVVYNEVSSKFEISTRCLKTNETRVHHFDKCVWACGENSKQYLPVDLIHKFNEGGFRGRIIHAADTVNLKEDVQGKRVLFIGGSYSAEDLALQAIKLGVEKLYVSTRGGGSYVSYQVFPMDKVEVLLYHEVDSITENGQCINFKNTTWTWPSGYETDGDEICTTLQSIDTVVLCTGYKVNLDMLDESLKKGYPQWGLKYELTVPDTWNMPPDNVLSKLTGSNVVPGTVFHNIGFCHPEFYRGTLISNPNMMFISIYDSYFPLLAVDTSAWMCVAFLTGRSKLPTQDEMRRRNNEQALHEMKIPYIRYYMDSNYNKVVDSNFDSTLWSKASEEYSEYGIKLLARDMEEAKYPASLGSYENINENGRALLQFNDQSGEHRYRLDKQYMEHHATETYRDCLDADKFYSLYTHTKAVPLQKKWLDIDPDTDLLEDFVEEKRVDA
jgi:thioredoxin reductase